MPTTGAGIGRIPLKIAAVYGALAALWILFSDALVRLFVHGQSAQQLANTLKGWAFVAVTAWILYAWMRRYVQQLVVEQRAVCDSSDRLTAIVDTVPSGILMFDGMGRFTFVNDIAQRILRLSDTDITTRAFDDAAWHLQTPEGRPLPPDRLPFALVMSTGEAVFDARLSIEHRDATRALLSVNAAPLHDAHGAITSVVASVDDITEQYEAEQRMVHSSRLYSMLSQTNEAIVRIRDVQQLYEEACRITVEYGQFKLAWIGILDEATSAVVPVAHAGRDEGYLADIRITASEDEPEGHGPVGTAVRLGRTVLSNDVASDPHMRPWAKEALARGYHAVGAFPLELEGKVFGSLNLYAADRGFFDAEETRLLDDLAGDIAFGVGHIRQDEERTRTEKELHRWRDAFYNTRVGIDIADADGVIIDVNPAFAEVHGYEADELAGRPIAEVYPLGHIDSTPDRLAEVRRAGHVAMETEHVRKDGTVFPVFVEVTTVKDADDRVLYSIGTVRDITDRKAAEQELARHREHLEELDVERTAELRRTLEVLSDEVGVKNSLIGSLNKDIANRTHAENALREANLALDDVIESSPLPVVALDRDQRVVIWNSAAERLFGWTRDEVLGRPNPAVAPEAVAEQRRLVEETFQGDHLEGYEVRRLRKSGEAVDVAIFTSAARDSEGEIKSAIGIFQDVTERRRIETIKSDFISTVSHELRTPLTAIVGYSELMREASARGESCDEMAEHVFEKAEELRVLVERLLEAASIQSGSTRLSLLPTDIGDFLGALAARTRTPGGFTLALDVESGPLSVVIDAQRLDQAIGSILANAFKYSPKGGTVRLMARRDGDAVEISVSDEGIGIPPEELPHVFERFTQVDMSTTREFGGIGLSLFTAMRVVEAHGGTIRADSEPGRGSTFTMRLPLTG